MIGPSVATTCGGWIFAAAPYIVGDSPGVSPGANNIQALAIAAASRGRRIPADPAPCDAFLIEQVFPASADQIAWNFTDLDRLAVGGVTPSDPVTLENVKQTGAEFFLPAESLASSISAALGLCASMAASFPSVSSMRAYVSMGSKQVTFARLTSARNLC